MLPGRLAQEKEAELGCLQHELRAGQEEAAGWQRRCRQLQGEADGRELELARRDLRAKEVEDALHALGSRAAEEAAAAASERQGLEGAVKTLEARLAQASPGRRQSAPVLLDRRCQAVALCAAWDLQTRCSLTHLAAACAAPAGQDGPGPHPG